MKKLGAHLALASMLFVGPLAGADDHIVSRGAVEQKLADARTERARNIATLDALLVSPGAPQAAAKVGLDIDHARRALPRLSDADLGDLAQRAAALRADPVAGHSYHHSDAADALILVMVVAGLALVILAIADRY